MCRKAKLLQVGAQGRSRDPLVTEVGDGRVPVPLGELLAVLAEEQSVMDDLRQCAADRQGDPALRRLVRPVVRAANHVRDAEAEVVRHGRELIGRATVGTEERHPVEPERSIGVARRAPFRLGTGSRRGVDVGPLALPDGALVPGDSEPTEVIEDGRFTAGHRAGRVGVVDAQDERTAALVREAAIGDRREGVSEMERPRRARCEANADAHASIGT